MALPLVLECFSRPGPCHRLGGPLWAQLCLGPVPATLHPHPVNSVSSPEPRWEHITNSIFAPAKLMETQKVKELAWGHTGKRTSGVTG